jgi:membrane complex biogenesis BtpA family protein
VLRNDARSALGIAAATDAGFIRVNIHSGAYVTDQGIIETEADETLRLRSELGAERIGIWADVLVKHAAPLAEIALEDAAEDLLVRELADALIVTGRATGKPADPEDVRVLRDRFPAAPIYVGSGVTPELAPRFLPAATGFIVGSWVKEGGRIERPVDVMRVRRLVEALNSPRPESTW